MRYLLYSLTFTLLIALSFSCSSEDESIIGNYKIISFGSSQCDGSIENLQFDFSGDKGCKNYSGIEMCGSGTLVFNPDNTWSINIELNAEGETITENAEGIYSIEGNTITICEDTDCETSIIAMGDRGLRLSYPNPNDVCLITLLAEKN